MSKLQSGESAPNFTLTDTERNKVSLEQLVEKGTVLLLFYPFAFSSTCTEEMCTVRDNHKLYQSLDTVVAGISVDSFFTLKAFKQFENINYTLLSDFNKTVSRNYGVLYEDFYGMKGVSKRAAFIIDKGRTIQYAEVLSDADQLPDFRSIQDLLSKIK